MLDILLFAVFPYVSIVVAVVVGLGRYYGNRFTFSSLSSQFLETRGLFWGSVPWHYGIVTLLTAHLVAWWFPGLWSDLLADPIRLYALELTGLALALVTTVSLGLLMGRRFVNARALAVTSVMDWALLAVLISQVFLGFWVALFYRWGSFWYLHTSVPWLNSLVLLDPQIQYVTALPWVVKLHLLGGFLLIFMFPFTRLVHVFTYPITYLWRPLQVVVWNRRPTA